MQDTGISWLMGVQMQTEPLQKTWEDTSQIFPQGYARKEQGLGENPLDAAVPQRGEQKDKHLVVRSCSGII